MKPGECHCTLGDPVGGSVRVNVLKVSGTEAVLEPTASLRPDQYVYATLKFEDGPSLALSGIVVAPASGGVFIQWSHAKPGDADKVDVVIQKYMQARARRENVPPEEKSTAIKAVGEAPDKTPAEKAGAKARKPAAHRPERKATTAKEGKEALVLSGGKLDVAETIRRRAKKVRAADLASKLETVDVLGMSMVKDLIKEAVNEAMVFLKPAFEESERKRLLEETEEA